MYLEKQIIETSLLRGLGILVIESKRDERDLLSYILESHGASVVSEASVCNAIGNLVFHPADVVFASTNVISEFGLAAQINILGSQAGKEVLIIGVSETNRATYPTMAEDLNCHACISKPLDMTEVVDLVATLAGRHYQQNSYLI
jgi:two-component system, chemotaxis family, CheB/CheR fusion protein